MRRTPVTILLTDTFVQPRKPGSVVGSRAADGNFRHGVDVEGVLSVDHGALRIEPLIQEGWGRSGVAYGPFKRRAGLALCVYMLNGHNTSQIDFFEDSLRHRFRQWAVGNAGSGESNWIAVKRLWRFLRVRRSRSILRRFRWWRYLAAPEHKTLRLDENLAVGWFPSEIPSAGRTPPPGNAMVMHALGGENGELWVQGRSAPTPVVRGYQNVQTYFVVVLRERGAAHFAASSPNAHGVAAYPSMRPLAVEPFRDDRDVYAGVHQSVLGQIGFWIDSRVYGVKVAHLSDLATWYGTAHAADGLTGSGSLDQSQAEVGGGWNVARGDARRSDSGAFSPGDASLALLFPGAETGLVHVLVEFRDAQARVGLVFRARSASTYWLLSVGPREAVLSIVDDGVGQTIRSTTLSFESPGADLRSLQLLDDGNVIAGYLDGTLLFDERIADSRLANAAGVGFELHGSKAVLRDFEAHPRSVPIPDALDFGPPFSLQGERTVASEDFEGRARTLEGKPTTTGGKVWQRTLGLGFIDVTGDGTAQVRASIESPNPGRTLYTFPWDDPGRADLQVDIIPPGSARGQAQRGRAGLVFWQDPKNYIVINMFLDDAHPGASISSFFELQGFDEIYDAAWTNMKRHIAWGKQCTLRVVFDGSHYLCYVNDEPVLYRSLTDISALQPSLAIKRVGLLVNWEWGDDTGSRLKHFVARA